MEAEASYDNSNNNNTNNTNNSANMDTVSAANDVDAGSGAEPGPTHNNNDDDDDNNNNNNNNNENHASSLLTFEILGWVDQFLYMAMKNAKTTHRLDLSLGVCAGNEQHMRFTLNGTMAHRLANFLKSPESVEIHCLLLECNVEATGGPAAMSVLAQAVAESCIQNKLHEIHLYGDYDMELGFTDQDNGTLLEWFHQLLNMIRFLVPNEEEQHCRASHSLLRVSFHYFDFRQPHTNPVHLQNAFNDTATAIDKLEFQSCLFDPNISWLTLNLKQQTQLQELHVSFLFVALMQTFCLRDDQLALLIRALPANLRILRLGDHCHMGETALQAFCEWISSQSMILPCRLVLAQLGTVNFWSSSSRPGCLAWKQPFVEAIRIFNLSLQEVYPVGDENDLRPLLRRNQLVAYIAQMGGAAGRMSLLSSSKSTTCCPIDQGAVWAAALATLARQPYGAMTLATPLFLAIESMSAMLADHYQPTKSQNTAETTTRTTTTKTIP